MEEAFLFFSLRRFSFKARDRATSDRKIYAIDNGLITATGFRSSPDRGKLYENLMEGLHVTQLIQVCRSLENPKTKTREARALPKAARELGCADLLVLTDSDEGEKRASWFGMDGNVRFLPLWRWFLEDLANPEADTKGGLSRSRRSPPLPANPPPAAMC